MQLHIRLFGITKDIIGQPKLQFEVASDARVQDVMHALQEKYPGLTKLHSVLIAVNDEYAQSDLVLNPNDEIALIPPVSGG